MCKCNRREAGKGGTRIPLAAEIHSWTIYEECKCKCSCKCNLRSLLPQTFKSAHNVADPHGMPSQELE